jgi:hypothetical protein
MGPTHRNAPCPCGSGRKYKRCCGAGDPDPRERELGSLLEAIEEVSKFAEREEFREEWELAHAQFWREWEDELAPDEVDSMLDDPAVISQFYLGFAADMVIREGQSVLDICVARRGSKMTAAVRAALEKLGRTYVGLYRVNDVGRHGGMRLSGILEPGELTIETDPMSEELIGAAIAARLFPLDDGTLVLVGEPYDFPSDEIEHLVEVLADDRSAIESVAGRMETPRFLKHVGLRFHSLWLESSLDVETLPIGPYAEFAVLAMAPLVRALDACEDLEASSEDDFWTWSPRGEPDDDDLVELSLEGDELLVTATTDEDLEAACVLVGRIAGQAVERIANDDERLEPEDFGIEEEF